MAIKPISFNFNNKFTTTQARFKYSGEPWSIQVENTTRHIIHKDNAIMLVNSLPLINNEPSSPIANEKRTFSISTREMNISKDDNDMITINGPLAGMIIKPELTFSGRRADLLSIDQKTIISKTMGYFGGLKFYEFCMREETSADTRWINFYIDFKPELLILQASNMSAAEEHHFTMLQEDLTGQIPTKGFPDNLPKEATIMKIAFEIFNQTLAWRFRSSWFAAHFR